MEHTIHKPDHDRDSAKQAHSSYWKFAHRDWRFWAGLILILGSMFIYLATQDLSWRLQDQAPTSQAPVSGVK